MLQLFDRAAYRVTATMIGDGVAAISVQQPAGSKPEERFFFSRLVTILNDTHDAPIFAEPIDTLKMTALTWQLSRCEIVYRPLSRRRFWQRARWQRTANVMIEISARETSTRQVQFQKIFTESAADTVAEKFLSRLEDQNLSFTVGRRERDDKESRWLEPVLITSATGIVVYLFYSLRSR